MIVKKLVLLLPILAVMLSACSTDSDIDAFIKNPGVKPARVPPLPEVKKFPIADYDRNGIKDPFSGKLIAASTGGAGSPDISRPRQVLEGFALESLKLNGYVVIDSTPYALVQDPDQQVHKIKAGQYLGQNFGKVIKISRSGISISESIQDNAGGWTQRQVDIPLNEKDAFNNINAARAASK